MAGWGILNLWERLAEEFLTLWEWLAEEFFSWSWLPKIITRKLFQFSAAFSASRFVKDINI